MKRAILCTSEKGMSLIEVMIAMGIMTIIFFAMTAFMNSSAKATRGVKDGLDFNNSVQRIGVLLSDSEVCKFVFNVTTVPSLLGKAAHEMITLPPLSIPQHIGHPQPSDPVDHIGGPNDKYQGLLFDPINLEYLSADSGTGQLTLNLRFTAKRDPKLALGGAMQNGTLALFATIDSAGFITDCSVASTLGTKDDCQDAVNGALCYWNGHGYTKSSMNVDPTNIQHVTINLPDNSGSVSFGAGQ